MSFTRQMGGVQPVNYGSIFIYKNGFGINPYGEPGQDFFNVNQRKAQGYNRYLGTREVMGRISIKGDNDQFVETSSRAHGFVQTPTVSTLQLFFLEKVLKVLEKYVVNIISWGEPIKSESNRVIEPEDVGDAIGAGCYWFQLSFSCLSFSNMISMNKFKMKFSFFENLNLFKPLIHKEYSGVEQKTTSQNPSIFWGGLLMNVGERLNGIQELDGSIPLISTTEKAPAQ